MRAVHRRPEGPTPAQPPAVPPSWPPLVRATEGRVIAGVAAGLAQRLGVQPLVLRVAFVVLTFSGGIGVLAYVLAWLLVPRAGSSGSIVGAAVQRGDDARPVVAVGMIVLGVLLLLRELGPWFSDALVWPVVLGAMGGYFIWRQADDDDKGRLAWMAAHLHRPGTSPARLSPAAAGRILLGVLLVTAGVALFLAANDALASLREGLVGTVAVVGGLALVFGPWWLRLVRNLARERRERIRSEERAEMAAHVHDSVLQTLSLIQRQADDPRAVTGLARQQERELRAWLYPKPATAFGDSLGEALEELGAEVEARHGVVVETVTVGDRPVDERLAALVMAAKEALTNAACHSGANRLSVYAEVEARQVTVFVRDRGAGFHPDEVPADRRGIADSIVGRMERHGGKAALRSHPGEGTEVELVMPGARR